MTAFSYQRAIGIGLGDLGNATLAQLRQNLPQSDIFVTRRGFHHAPAQGNDESYALQLPQDTRRLYTRADIREDYLWHLSHRRSALYTHLTSAMNDIQGGVVVYLFVDLRDPLSALMLDVFHLVTYLLRTNANNPPARWLIFVALPDKKNYDAGQFATLREWLRFTYGTVAQNLFAKESPFAYLNIDHPVLFNRLLVYMAHPHLAQLWADVGLAQLQGTPPNSPQDNVYSHQFIEYQMSNFSNRAQGILMSRGQTSDDPMLLCGGFSAYSVALPMVYLHEQWSAGYIKRFLTHYLGEASDTHIQKTLLDWLSWRDVPPILLQAMNRQTHSPMQQDMAIQNAFLASTILYNLPQQAKMDLIWTPPNANPDWKRDDTDAFMRRYAQITMPIMGDSYVADYPSGRYGAILADSVVQIVDALEAHLIEQITDWLNKPLDSGGGLAVCIGVLARLNWVITPLLAGLQHDISTTQSLMQTRKQFQDIVREQLLLSGHVSRFGRLLPQAERFLQNQVDDILSKKYYQTLAFAIQVLEGITNLIQRLTDQLTHWQASLLALHAHLETAQKSSIRPTNSDFCWWIHDPAWEKNRLEHLWQQSSEEWHHHLRWAWDSQQLTLGVNGTNLVPSDNPQLSHLPYWMNLVNLDHVSTNLWEIYAQDEVQAARLFTQLQRLIHGDYHPMSHYSADVTRLLAPVASVQHIGEQTFMRLMNERLAPQKLIQPSGERITYMIEYEEQPLQELSVYWDLQDKYVHFLNVSSHHLFTPERTVIAYEAVDNWQLFSAPVVALFEYEARLQLFALLAALDFWCEQPLEDTDRYLGLLVDGVCVPLTKPSESPNWYDATYQFVWHATTSENPPVRWDEARLRALCDTAIAQRLSTTSLEAGQGKEWDKIRNLARFRPNKFQPAFRIGVLLNIYSDYLMRCQHQHAQAQTRIMADLYRALMLITQAQISRLREELGSYRI